MLSAGRQAGIIIAPLWLLVFVMCRSSKAASRPLRERGYSNSCYMNPAIKRRGGLAAQGRCRGSPLLAADVIPDLAITFAKEATGAPGFSGRVGYLP
jgi:hypothetical protein